MLVPAAARAQCCSRGRAGGSIPDRCQLFTDFNINSLASVDFVNCCREKIFFPVTVLFFFSLYGTFCCQYKYGNFFNELG